MRPVLASSGVPGFGVRVWDVGFWLWVVGFRPARSGECRPCSPTTQELRADLGKQVSSHGTCANFPTLRFVCGENVHLLPGLAILTTRRSALHSCVAGSRVRVWGLGFGIWGFSFGLWGVRFGVWGCLSSQGASGVWLQDLGFRVWSLGFEV